jgi:TRAP-type C4-dicarboxylate transport system substrate-binding protein
MRGFKIRVPPAPLVVSMFKALNAGPTALALGEVYTSLQTKVVDGQENPLTTIYADKFYEVQKYCSITNHQWNGDWLVMNPRTWNAVPKDLQAIVARNLDQSAVDLRSDVSRLNQSLVKTLTDKGLTINTTQAQPFRDTLNKSGFYAEWRKKFGAENWAVLAKYATGLS